MNDSPHKAYYTISEVADLLQVNASLLRFWEKQFPKMTPRKAKGNRRLYTEKDISYIKEIYHALKVEGLTIEGARKKLGQHTRRTSLSGTELPAHRNAADRQTRLSQIQELVRGLKECNEKLRKIIS